jgi:hypothetical protein
VFLRILLMGGKCEVPRRDGLRWHDVRTIFDTDRFQLLKVVRGDAHTYIHVYMQTDRQTHTHTHAHTHSKEFPQACFYFSK